MFKGGTVSPMNSTADSGAGWWQVLKTSVNGESQSNEAANVVGEHCCRSQVGCTVMK